MSILTPSADSTSGLSIKRGSTMLKSTIGRTARSSWGLGETCAFRPFRHATGSALARSIARNADRLTRTVSKHGVTRLPVAGSIVSTKQLSTRLSTIGASEAKIEWTVRSAS